MWFLTCNSFLYNDHFSGYMLYRIGFLMQNQPLKWLFYRNEYVTSKLVIEDKWDRKKLR